MWSLFVFGDSLEEFKLLSLSVSFLNYKKLSRRSIDVTEINKTNRIKDLMERSGFQKFGKYKQ